MVGHDCFRNRLVSRDFELPIVFGIFGLPPSCMNILAAARAHGLRAVPLCTAQAGTVCVLAAGLLHPSELCCKVRLEPCNPLFCKIVLCPSLTSAVSGRRALSGSESYICHGI